jgi:hypothetical protein
MKYLCLIYSDESQFKTMTQEQGMAMMGEYKEFGDGIKKSGHYVGGNRLEGTHTATVVRVRNGKTATTDGPYAETKEQLGGYYLIEARDLNEAIAIAAKIPAARNGAVEVRPISPTMAD